MSNVPSTPPVAHATSRFGFSWVAALLLFVILGFMGATRIFPPLPEQIVLTVVFPPADAERVEPLISTGQFGTGDFLYARFQPGNKVVLGYDAWGEGGPTSAAQAYTPGTAYRLVIAMPSLAETEGRSTRTRAPVSVRWNDEEILKGDAVLFHRRKTDEVYFGANPIHGSTELRFRGTISSQSGHKLFGGPACYFSAGQRAAAVFADGVRLCGMIALSAIAGFALPALRNWLRRLSSAHVRRENTASPRAWFAVAAALSVVGFTLLLTGGTGRIFYADSFANFYDHQALSLLKGRLDVPEEALSGEAFLVNGKRYGYFGPTPALLRLPFAATQIGFGQLTRAAMIVYFAAALLAAYALLIQATRMLYGPHTYPSRGAVVLLVACAGLGSTLLFLGSRAYVYHEANLCGAMFALWSAYHSLRYLEDQGGKRWLPALICGLLSLHARPPTGLFALCVLGSVALVHLGVGLFGRPEQRSAAGRSPTTGRMRRALKPLAVGLLAAAGILSFNALSYAKFGTFDGAPLKYHVQYSKERLDRFDGTNFHLANVRHNADAYLLVPAIHFDRHFPWVYFGSNDTAYPEARIDIAEPTMSIPLAMSGLAAATVLGGFWIVVFAPRARLALGTLTLGLIPMALALLAAVATSHRYTSDFCPFLIAVSALAVAAFDGANRSARWVLHGVLGALAALSIWVTGALAFQYQLGGVWGVPDDVKARDEKLAHRVDAFFKVQ